MSLFRIPKFIMADTGFWIGLCDRSDSFYKASAALFEPLCRFNVVVPWPLFYEVLRTRCVKQRSMVETFARSLRSAEVHRIDDSKYREKALDIVLGTAGQGKRAISLVDMVLRLIIEDEGVRLHGLVTYNSPDFQDSCRRRRIPMLRCADDMGLVFRPEPS